MNILSDVDRVNLCSAHYNSPLEMVDAVANAILHKLAQGVSVEPFWIRQEDVCGNSVGPDIPYYRQDDFNTALAAARVRALEEAAKVVLKDCVTTITTEYQQQYNATLQTTADAIRSLVGKELT